MSIDKSLPEIKKIKFEDLKERINEEKNLQELSSEIWHKIVDVLAEPEQNGLPIAGYHADTEELEQIYSRRGWYYSGTIDVFASLIMRYYTPCVFSHVVGHVIACFRHSLHCVPKTVTVL